MNLPQASAMPTAAAVEEEAEAVCFGCGAAIYDPFIMHVQPDLKWHGRCLKCHKCERGLSDETSCFVRNGKAYCREDYCKYDHLLYPQSLHPWFSLCVLVTLLTLVCLLKNIIVNSPKLIAITHLATSFNAKRN